MTFICRLVEDCLKSEGTRDYLFSDSIPPETPSIIENELRLKTGHQPDESRATINDKEYCRLEHPYFLISFLMPSKSIRVEYQDYHPENARSILESIFEGL